MLSVKTAGAGLLLAALLWTTAWAAAFFYLLRVVVTHHQPLAEGTVSLSWVVPCLAVTGYVGAALACRQRRWLTGIAVQLAVSFLILLCACTSLFLQWFMLAVKG